MGDPFSPDPRSTREHRQLVDRASLLGDAGRSARRMADAQDAEDFQSLLEGKTRAKDRGSRKSGAEEEEDAALQGFVRSEERAAPREGAALLDAGALEARTEARGRKETEKRLGSWQGPSPFAGLPAAANLGLQAAGDVQRGERSRGESRTAMRTEIRPGEARVDVELLQALTDAGLAQPIKGLDDPRLAATPPMLSPDEGWRDHPTAHGLAWSWEGPGKKAWQRLEWSEGHVLLETAGHDRQQILERQGSNLYVRHSRSDAPPAFPA